MRAPRISTRLLMLTVAASALIFGGIRSCHYLYYMDLIYTQNQFEQVKGITDVHIYGSDDVTYEVYYATFSLVGRPDAVIGIQGPAGGLVGNPEHLWISNLGPVGFYEYSYGFQNMFDTSGNPTRCMGSCDWIDIGPSGDYAALLPVKIRDLNDVVSHYDELVRFFSGWANENRWKELPTHSDMRRMYYVSPTGTRPTSPPPNFP